MLFIPALALIASCSQSVSAPPAALEPLDARWIPGIGTVELSTAGGPRLTIKIRDSAGASTVRNLDLDVLDPNSVVVEARAASFIAKEGLVIGLAAQTGDTTSYHSLLIHRLADEPADARTTRTNRRDGPSGRAHWWLTTPIFTSTGERYRVVDVHNPGSDSIELTFRRGYVDTRRGEPRMDEKIYVNDCPGGEDPKIAGSLLDISAARSAK
jgi:hypothetical protein